MHLMTCLDAKLSSSLKISNIILSRIDKCDAFYRQRHISSEGSSRVLVLGSLTWDLLSPVVLHGASSLMYPLPVKVNKILLLTRLA